MNVFLCESNRIKRYLSPKIVNVVVVLLGVLKFILYGLNSLSVENSDWQAYELTANYSFGFIKRALLGTIVRFMADNMGLGYSDSVYLFMLLEEIIFTVIMFSLALCLVNKFKDPNLNLIVLLFLSTDIVGFYYFDWGEPDILLMSLTVIACILIIRDKALWLVPLLSALCVLIHEGYVSMYFGLVIALLCIMWISESGKNRARFFVTMMITGLLCTSLFLYFYLYSEKAFTITSQEFVDYSVEALGSTLTSEMNLLSAFWNIGTPAFAMWENGVPTLEFWYRMIVVLFAAVLCLPLVFYKFSIWKRIIISEKNKFNRFIYLFCASFFILTIPLIVLHTDEGRWLYDLVFQEFMLLFCIYIMDHKNVRSIVSNTVKCNALNMIILIYYCVFFIRPNKQAIDDMIADAASLILHIIHS